MRIEYIFIQKKKWDIAFREEKEKQFRYEKKIFYGPLVKLSIEKEKKTVSECDCVSGMFYAKCRD